MSETTWSAVRDDETVNRTVEALKGNGLNVLRVKTGAEAKARVLELIPEGAEVFTLSSVTLDSIGLSAEINESGNYRPTRDKLNDANLDDREKARTGAAPEWAVGSVHAVTEDGKVLIASNTGSQLPADAYGAAHVVWVVGTQKIVKDTDEAMKRIHDYILPKESVRLKAAYGLPEDHPGSFVSKLLIVNREINTDRTTVIFVDEVLGF
jgi:hypothetical protein